MDILAKINSWLQLNEATQQYLVQLGLSLGLFLLFVILSAVAGRYTPLLVHQVLRRVSSQNVVNVYNNLVVPTEDLFRLAGTFVLISVSLNVLNQYKGVHQFLSFFISLGVIVSISWLISRLFKQFVHVYGIEMIRRLGLEIDEMLLVAETLVNVLIGFIGVITFAQSQSYNLIGIIAGLGVGGVAIAFAAQNTLEQLLGTIVLYLDRPYVRGDYIRVGLNPHTEPVYGRIESIGLRSTKIRTAAQNTLVIVPNSTMANIDIENITRGKKVMVLLYLDFTRELEPGEQALVQQVVKESTDALYGIDPGSTRLGLFQPEDSDHTRARVTFFILGSNENSIELRKRLLELANEKISRRLSGFGLEFSMQEPTIYVDSPVTI